MSSIRRLKTRINEEMINELILVYGLKTDDCEWALTFYPVRRLIEEGKKKNLRVSFFLPDAFSEYARQNVLENTVVFLRGDIRNDIFELLEKKQETENFVFNPSKLSKLTADDKKIMYDFLSENGFPIPNTYEKKEDFTFPLITKPRFGSQGRGIKIFYSRTDIPFSDNFVYQQFLPFKEGTDIRILISFGKIIKIVQRENQNGATSNFHSGGCIKDSDIPEKYKKDALKIYEKLGIFFMSVDFIYKDDNEFVICEINASPGFEGIEKNLNVNIASNVIEGFLALQ